MTGGCEFAWQSDGFGWIPPGASGVTQLTSADGSVIITSPEGPVTDLAALYAPIATPVGSAAPLTTSTLPGASPYAGAQPFLLYGTALDPIDVAPGKYLGMISLVIEGSSNNVEYWWQFFVNGAPVDLISPNLKPASAPIGKAGANTTRTSIVFLEFFAPTSVFLEVRVALGGGVGSVTYNAGSYSLWRAS